MCIRDRNAANCCCKTSTGEPEGAGGGAGFAGGGPCGAKAGTALYAVGDSAAGVTAAAAAAAGGPRGAAAGASAASVVAAALRQGCASIRRPRPRRAMVHAPC